MLYVPSSFDESDRAALQAFITAHGFATLISPDAHDPPVTHLPLMLDPTRGELGVLTGHVARANPHWRHLESGAQVLAIFHGPHAYVSPSWYGHHPSVPTWNYAVVHVHGRARVTHDVRDLERIVQRLVEQYEGARSQPWRMQLPADYQAQMLSAIVGFEVEIARISGKFKLSQNRPAADRPRIIEALSGGGAGERAVAEMMHALERRDREA
jgi:transcriptional regulator